MRQTRSVMLVATLLLSSMVVFAGTAAADDFITIYGIITDADGNGYEGHSLTIQKCDGGNWNQVGLSYELPHNGVYTAGGHVDNRNDTYRMLIDGSVVSETYKGGNTWNTYASIGTTHWSYCQWDGAIPEFATIAIPAIALLGLYAFSRRKQKK